MNPHVGIVPYAGDSKSDACPELCTGNNACCCENKRDIGAHELHICEDSTCICHSKGRYFKPKKMNDKKWITVGRVGMIRFVQYTGKVGFIPLKPREMTKQQEADWKRSKGLEKIPNSVAPGWFGDEALDLASDALERQTDSETFDNLIDLMEQENGKA